VTSDVYDTNLSYSQEEKTGLGDGCCLYRSKSIKITSRDLEFEFFLHHDPNKPSKYVLKKTLARHFTFTFLYGSLKSFSVFATLSMDCIIRCGVSGGWRGGLLQLVGNALLCHRVAGLRPWE
jgi:hypothetical protein